MGVDLHLQLSNGQVAVVMQIDAHHPRARAAQARHACACVDIPVWLDMLPFCRIVGVAGRPGCDDMHCA